MDLYFEKLSARLQSVIESHPDKIAYIQGTQEVTYAQLDKMACHIASGIARKVQDSPVPADVPVRVGIALGRSEPYVPCILAAIKLGCSYVPIDVEAPRTAGTSLPGTPSWAFSSPRTMCSNCWRAPFWTSFPSLAEACRKPT